MRFLRDEKGTSTAEWVVVAAAVIAVIGTMILTIANTTQAEGSGANTWIQNIPDPS
jgi:Flp pilus assembly pilin Flp